MTDQLLTYQDAYEHLIDVFDQEHKSVGVQRRRLRRAITTAYQKLPSLHNWSYFKGTGEFLTSPPENHTVVYTASNSTAVIQTGKWNDDAIYGTVTIGIQKYNVIRRVSDTEIQISNGPEADYSGVLRWTRYRYPLPSNVGDVKDIIDPIQSFDLNRVTVDQTFWWQQIVNAESYPLVWSVFPSSTLPGQWEIWLSGSGQIQRKFSYLYQKRTTNLSILELNKGTVSITGDEATFTGVVLAESAVGSVLRVSSTADHPTGYLGRSEKDPDTGRDVDVLNPPDHEFVITAITNGTTASLLQRSPVVIENKGYSISSHIDVNYEIMWELFLRLCEEQYDILSRAETVIRNLSFHARKEAMRAAMIADGPAHSPTRAVRFRGNVVLEK